MSRLLTTSFVLALAGTAAAQSPEPQPAPPAEPAPAEPAPPEAAKPEPEAAKPEAAKPTEQSVKGAIAGVSITTDAQKDDSKKPLVLKPGGYIQSDARTFANDGGTREITIRRLRFKLDGSAYKLFNFRTLIDFAGSKVVVDDAWGEIALRPELALRFGKDKGQFGIERLQSAAQLTFIERSYPTQLSPNRDIGIWARGDVQGGLVHYAVGAVDGVADNAVIEGETDDELEYNAHLLVSPFKGSALKRYGDLAVGGATTFGRNIGTVASPGLTPIKSTGQVTIVKYAAGTDDATTARTEGYRTRLAAHAYYFGGPVGALAEYVRDTQKAVLGGSHTEFTNRAWQVAASVALTPGDRPTYRGFKVQRPFDPATGQWGAVEVAARFATLHIDPELFSAGISSHSSSVDRARAFTLGANWYFNEYLKLQLDYEGTVFRGGAMEGNRETEHVFSTRFQASI